MRLVLDNLAALVAILDPDERYRFANQRHQDWFGRDPASLTGLCIADVVGEQAWSVLAPHFREALAGHECSFSRAIPLARGGERVVHGNLVPMFNEDGETEGVLLQCSDITELELTREALDASTLRSRTILDTAVDAIITIDEGGIILSVNQSVERLFGYSAGELLGYNIKKLMPARYAHGHDGYMQRYLNTGEKRIIGIGREVTARRKDSTEFPIHLAVGEFVEGERHYFTGFIRDMSAQKEAEQQARAHLDQLAHVTRLSAIDNLASGISHEINQPLTAIVTMSQALLRGLRAGRSDPAMLEDTLERIVRQGSRANSIVQQMREFARKDQSTERIRQQVDPIIDDVLKLLEYEIGEFDIHVETDLAANGSSATVNRIQIEQVLLNLIQNAVHAMAEKMGERRLTITSGLSDEQPGYLRIQIADTGTGLPEDGEANVFDPFFTTKERGMGQGLSIGRSIVEEHGGTISARNSAEGGAIFEFALPAGAAVDD